MIAIDDDDVLEIAGQHASSEHARNAAADHDCRFHKPSFTSEKFGRRCSGCGARAHLANWPESPSQKLVRQELSAKVISHYFVRTIDETFTAYSVRDIVGIRVTAAGRNW